jgi:hypothetical protein
LQFEFTLHDFNLSQGESHQLNPIVVMEDASATSADFQHVLGYRIQDVIDRSTQLLSESAKTVGRSEFGTAAPSKS